MKDKKENVEVTKPQESGKSWFVANINTCIACGREIPEGRLACMECEIGKSQKRCTICDRLVAESEAICSNCKTAIFRSKIKD